MKIGLLNIKYGPNLGDGAIAECLEGQLKAGIPGVELVAVDVGGREEFGGEGSILGARLGLTQRLGFLPTPVQSLIKTTLMPPMVARKYAGEWRARLRDCDALIVGGGHLLMDVDLYFPYRIMLAVKQARRGVPIFVHGVGVSKIWTPRGRACFDHVFQHGRLVSASVRDKQSLENWQQLFPNAEATVCRDPALLAADFYGPMGGGSSRKRKCVAVGVADKDSLRQHADKDMAVIFGEIESYIRLLRELDAAGYDVLLFSNGADDEYLQQIVSTLRFREPALLDRLSVARRPRRPIDLVRDITQADVLIAHRLHANILAYAYGIPSIGLGWDRKLSSFFEASGRTKYLVRSEEQARELPRMVAELLAAGPLSQRPLIDEARRGAAELVSAVKRVAEA